jgi:DNA-binding MarR family transcriptional regulator
MPYLMLKEVPRYECLRAAADRVPGGDPAACDLFLNLLHTGDVVARAEADFLARFGLNQARLIILMLLDQAGTGTMRSSELADHAKVTRATMTGLLDTLERAGWVARAPDPQDRRAHNVKITPRGEALVRRVFPELSAWVQRVIGPLSTPERTLLAALLRKAQAAFAPEFPPEESL